MMVQLEFAGIVVPVKVRLVYVVAPSAAGFVPAQVPRPTPTTVWATPLVLMVPGAVGKLSVKAAFVRFTEFGFVSVNVMVVTWPVSTAVGLKLFAMVA